MTANQQDSVPGKQPEESTGDEQLPTFAEQLASQLGGWRGSVEAAVPVVVFVVVNMAWSLRPALIASVGLAFAIAGVRLAQRRPIRYALNGLFGIALGGFIAWRTGEARDFYLPGIIISYGYAAAMIASVLVRHPLVGWLYSVLFTEGKADWRDDPRLMRTFLWLTLLWAAVWIAKVTAQYWLYLADEEHLLGIARLALGTPPYLLLLAITLWVVRRTQRTSPAS